MTNLKQKKIDNHKCNVCVISNKFTCSVGVTLFECFDIEKSLFLNFFFTFHSSNRPDFFAMVRLLHYNLYF